MAFVNSTPLLSTRTPLLPATSQRSTTFRTPTTPLPATRHAYSSPRMSATERTFLAVKPDGVNRSLVGSIITRFESRGYTLVGLKLLKPTRELAEEHYAALKERPFFSDLVDFITSGPVVAMVWQGEGVVTTARKMIGQTSPLESDPGTIRGDYAVDVGRNVIHGSDAVETANREIALWFEPSELVDWTPTNNVWIYE